ncbi:unnamed protein product [Rotaria sp. Silwood2]|nr:unnamed protein product [Rotaria sp. Silwood2]
MAGCSLIALPNHELLEFDDSHGKFFEIHLDKLFYVGDNLTLHETTHTKDQQILVKENYKLYGDPDQCINFITSFSQRKVFISLTDEFSYLIPLIHDLPQILYIYIYSNLPENVSYSSTNYPKLRSIINQNLPDADQQIFKDIEMFERGLLSTHINHPKKQKTKLLIQEPIIIEEYLVLWIEDNNDSDTLDTTSITKIIPRLDFSFDIQHCIEMIQTSCANNKIFLVSSHSETKTLFKEVAHLSNILALYVFDREQRLTITLDDSNTKWCGQYSDLKSLAIQLSHDYKRLKETSSLPISSFHREQSQKTVRDLNKESARFLWLQLLIDILIRTPCYEQAKEDMLDECRTCYKDNASELRKIDKFSKTYQSSEALKFYTGDSFIYRLFNQAFRKENIDLMFIFHFFLVDLNNQLQKLYAEQFINNARYPNDKLVVYRGQSMRMPEFDQIKNNIGFIISINTFFSTTKNHEVAKFFLGSTTTDSEFVSVIFEIEVHLTHHATKRPFASIEHLSQFPEEEEILFSVGSVFRILDVDDRRATDGHWFIKMMMVENDDDLNELRSQLDQQYSRYGNLCDLGSALIGMGDYDRAERYFQILLEYTPESKASFGIIQNCLGIIYVNRGDYQKAFEFQERALKFWTQESSIQYNQHHIANTYVHLGAAYRHLGQLDLALKHLLIAVELQSPTTSLAFTYNEIAITYRNKGDNRLALNYFLKALDIDENVLKYDKYHPTLATAYNNIGEIYSHLGAYDDALKYLTYALEICLKGTVATHTDLAAIYNNLGVTYLEKKDFSTALEMYTKALEIDSEIFHEDHESLATSHHQIATVHLELGTLSEALYHAEKALRIVLRSQAKENLSLVSIFQYGLGLVQYRLGNMGKALKMAEKALNNLLACSAEHQKMAATIYNFFSLIYEKEGDIVKALEYVKKAIEQAKIWATRNRTFELEKYLVRLDQLKNKESERSFTSEKMLLDHMTNHDDLIRQFNEKFQQTSPTDILERLQLINSLTIICSRQNNFSAVFKYFNEANIIYSEHQSSNLITKEQIDEIMIHILFNTARSYYRQQNWTMSLKMFEKSRDLVRKQKDGNPVLPEIYYCMAAVYAHLGEIQMAIDYYELTISTARKRLSDDHPDVQRYTFQFQLFKNNLEEAYSKGYLIRK